MNDLVIITIYRDPSDHPDGYAVRPWTVTGHGAIPQRAKFADTLAEARALIPAGATWLERHPDDDPVIVESWML